ncbi:hypothetical protein F2Q69_00050310 [Brassica cretica]|uniref:Uncharacterized protein n=1 Tax=Brassica cretica TaxID=69181 RepID=A0A8S9PLY3_BRACR|nr:hypothetical protein F2Q69_00050310 [Brassica cretica]
MSTLSLRRISISTSIEVPQTGVPSIRHSTFESLCVGCSSQSIASNLLAYGIPLTSRKTVSLWESRFSSLMKRFLDSWVYSCRTC